MKSMRIHHGEFSWMYYPARQKTGKAIIAALGDSDCDTMVKAAAKWLGSHGVDVLALAPMRPGERYTGWHNFPLETYEEAAAWLLANGAEKVGVTGGSTTGMLALVAAAHIPRISLVLAYTPSDFLFQGFYTGKLDGRIPEWPAPGQSCVTWRGEPVPFSPFNLSNEDYYNKTFGASTKESGEMNSLPLFDHLEQQPEFERGLIPVENIQGDILCFGAEDDTLWRTARYIRRMEKRLADVGFAHRFEGHVYELGTHFIFPQGLMKAVLPIGVNALVGKMFRSGKAHPKECEAARIDVEHATLAALARW